VEGRRAHARRDDPAAEGGTGRLRGAGLAWLCVAKYIAAPSALLQPMMTGPAAYRFAVGLALVATLLLAWMSLGVGVIGADGDPANLMYAGVIGVGVVGAFAAHFRSRGMARALSAMAIAQALVGVIALVGRLGYPYSGPLELVGLT